MIRRKKDNVEWLEFEQLQEFPNLVHGVFTRHVGISGETFLNILEIEKLVSIVQVHGANVLHVSSEKQELDGGFDALTTAQNNMGLLIKHADCQATIFFDPIQKVIANVHCGWRGSVHNIYANTVKELIQKYHCNPANLLACISPSLGPNKAEFINHRVELPPTFLPFQVRENYFDFWEISRMQLKEVGLLDHHIEIAKMCTFTEEKDFFSYRRDKKTSNNGTVVALR